jgi:hypothetical protein
VIPCKYFSGGVGDLSFPRVAAARGIPDSRRLFGAQVTPGGVGRFNQRDFRSACHLLDLALAGNSLIDIIELFEVDEPVDVITSGE